MLRAGSAAGGQGQGFDVPGTAGGPHGHEGLGDEGARQFRCRFLHVMSQPSAEGGRFLRGGHAIRMDRTTGQGLGGQGDAKAARLDTDLAEVGSLGSRGHVRFTGRRAGDQFSGFDLPPADQLGLGRGVQPQLDRTESFPSNRKGLAPRRGELHR